MTEQTKRFIAPSDITSLQVICNGCATTVLLPLDREIDVKRFYVCPHCQRPWIRTPEGASAEVAIEDCIRALRDVRRLLQSRQFTGFSIALEIIAEEEENKPLK
jgi:hypothetical protein